jgi:Tfp pilus assembly major pilin PilA
MEHDMTRFAAGFTLVEAVIVLTVLSFGLSVALPAYRDYQLRETVELVIRAAAPAKVQVEEFASANASLPDSAAIALPFPTQAQVRSTAWVGSETHGTITISIATLNGAPAERGVLDAKQIVLGATYDPVLKRVSWTCGGTRATTVHSRYLPAHCR